MVETLERALATCIEDMNKEVETATGNYANAQAAADEALSKAGPAATAATEAATAANAAAGANIAADNANKKAANLISNTTLAELGLIAESMPDEAILAIVNLM